MALTGPSEGPGGSECLLRCGLASWALPGATSGGDSLPALSWENSQSQGPRGLAGPEKVQFATRVSGCCHVAVEIGSAVTRES